jgi:hypothetical protein
LAAELRFTENCFSHFQPFEDILTEDIGRKAFKRVDVHLTSFGVSIRAAAHASVYFAIPWA